MTNVLKNGIALLAIADCGPVHGQFGTSTNRDESQHEGQPVRDGHHKGWPRKAGGQTVVKETVGKQVGDLNIEIQGTQLDI
jgi:uncharacterized protein YjbJ (UPF0337 family)